MDRSIAQLLFHRPSDVAARPTADTIISSIMPRNLKLMESKDNHLNELQQEATANIIEPTKRPLSGCPKPPAMEQPYNNCRKTRDLPNLSQCHACGFRADVCTGKDQIQVLYSEWRIVLLCKKCIVRVESSKVCSYCFEEAADKCFCCSRCGRSIHTDCFSSYKTVPPWSYSCAGAELLVCVDCWVPKAIENRRAISGGKICKTELNSTGSRVFESGNARVLDDRDCTAKSIDDGDCAKSMDDVVKDVNSVVEKKVKVAERAREEALRKAVVARKAVELASNALDLISKRDEKSSAKECDCDERVDDSELAFRLHRAMNSSPRISKNLCEVNSGCTRGESSGCRKLEISVDGDSSGHPAFIRIGGGDSSSYRDYSKSHGLVYVRRKRKVGKCCHKSAHADVEVSSIEGNESCSNKLLNSSIIDESMNLESQIFCKQDDCNQPMDARCNGKGDRYLLKYRRKSGDRYLLKYRRKSGDRYFLKYRRKSGDRYFLKYRRKSGWRSTSNGRRRFLYEGVYHQIQASVCELPLNCSRESIGFSNCSFQSCDFCLQASASASASGLS